MKKLEVHSKRSNYSKNIYFLFSYFISCAFLGWIFETIAVLIMNHQLTARGFLFVGKNINHYFPFLSTISFLKNVPFIWGLPIIEIYGIGGCIVVLLFNKLSKKSILLFFISMFLLTLFELISSYFCSYIFHKFYWDYSKEFLNFQGRICLRSSITWGIISVITVKYLIPLLELIYAEERRIFYYKNIMRVLFLYTLICNFYKFIFLK